MTTPYNVATGKEFGDKAAETLIAAGFKDPRWLTAKQVEALAGDAPCYKKEFQGELKSGIPRLAGVKRSAVGVRVVVHFSKENPKTGETSKGRSSYVVFNMEQTYGLRHLGEAV